MKIEKARQIYILHNRDINIVKIGISENIKARQSALENECGCVLYLVYESEHLINPQKHEKKIHDTLSEYRRKGEWFNVSPEKAISTTIEVTKGAIYDPLISKYKKGASISELAKTYNVTRQAVIMKLRLYGVYTEGETVCEIYPASDVFKKMNPPKNKKRTKASTIIQPTVENKIVGNDPPAKAELTNLKRVEPNINSNGVWNQAFIFKNGCFINFYTKNIEEARNFISNTKANS